MPDIVLRVFFFFLKTLIPYRERGLHAGTLEGHERSGFEPVTCYCTHTSFSAIAQVCLTNMSDLLRRLDNAR